jgi:YHS domain-containing protein
MKLFVVLLTVSLGFAAASLKAEEKKAAAATTQPTTAPSTSPAAATPANQKCPVSGDPVAAKGKTVIYQGKTIGFCCDDCVEPFQKNPEKYAKNIK